MVADQVLLDQVRGGNRLDVSFDTYLEELPRQRVGDLVVRERTRDDQLELESLCPLRPHLRPRGEHPAGGVQRLGGGHRVVWMAGRRGLRIGPVSDWDRARVRVAATGQGVGPQALPGDRLGQGQTDLDVAEEWLGV